MKIKGNINRREFIKLSAAGGAVCLAGPGMFIPGSGFSSDRPISPGCRKSKVKVAKIYLGQPQPHWPTPSLDLEKEVRFYESQFAKMKKDFSDVDFVVDQLVSSSEQIEQLKGKIQSADGILAIHLTIWTGGLMDSLQSFEKPTLFFSAPYSGHEWVGFGKRLESSHIEAMLTSDHSQLAAAVRPFRAIHHLREAKILNLTTRNFKDQAESYKTAFGTEINSITLDRMLKIYSSVSEKEAREETSLWLRNAQAVVEPSREDIYRSSRLALAFQRLLDEEQATVMTVDCYGTMFDKTIKLPAYPCLGFARLNNRGWGGICESDLRSAMTHILFQGLTGRPGFISDPTVDESKDSIILAHCLGSPQMDGPDGLAAPFKLRTIMERQEGVVPQAEMRIGQKVTQAILLGTDLIRYFTGEIVDAPVGVEYNRGCRTKIAVRPDGDLSTLWRNWAHGLHRQTVYGDITRELRTFCKYKGIKLVNEAARG
ncbi:twin-arginine translocation signal domain-containing protein [Acidobacteriota bacterium]